MLPFPDNHRPFPAPSRPWFMWQRWQDLLFAHWPIPVATLRPFVPAALTLDTFDGHAWISVVPFRMSGVRPRYLPAVPGISAFPELNVRTYVVFGGRPGVYFFSLDATNPFVVRLARVCFSLPYQHAAMSLREIDGWIHYQCQRTQSRARFVGRYQPIGEVLSARPGSLDYWLTERYLMFPVARDGRVFGGDIHHGPWPLQPARAEISINSMTLPLGFELTGPPASLHFSKELQVVVWGLESNPK